MVQRLLRVTLHKSVYSVTRQEPVRNGEFLDRFWIFGVVVPTAELGRQLREAETQWTWNRAEVEPPDINSTTTGNTAMCLHTRDGINVSGDSQIAHKISGLQRSIHISWTGVRLKQHHFVSQHWWNDTQRVLRQQNRVCACEWCVSTAGGHVSARLMLGNSGVEDADWIRARQFVVTD